MGPWMATALVMGVMIGAGVFMLPAQLAPFGWNAVAAWGISIGGVMALALVLARLTRALPDASGPTGFVAAAFGPIPAFLIGYSYWISCWVSVVALAVAAVSALSIFAPGLAEIPYLPTILAVALLWTGTLITLRGAAAAGAFQLVTMAFKLIPLIVVIVLLGLLVAQHGSAAIAPFPSEGLRFGATATASTLTLFALVGFESASVTASAVEDPARNVPRATLWGTALTGLLYLVVCSGIALTLPQALVAHSNAPFATFITQYWAREPALFVTVFVAICAIGSMGGNILMTGELPLAMARQGSLPRWFGVTSARGVPARALIVSSGLATLFVAFYASKTMADLFTFLALLLTSACLWLYLACALAALWLRVAMPVAALGLAFSLWALWGAGPDISALSLVMMASGLPLYYWARRERAVPSAATPVIFE
jgi:basic amino acid/polyamine antiporter, APA family